MNDRELLSAILKNQELMSTQIKTMQDDSILLQKSNNDIIRNIHTLNTDMSDMIKEMKNDMQDMKKDIKDMKKDIKDMNQEMKEGFTEVNDRLDRNDQRFSWLETDLNRTKSKIR